jgi:phage gp46-like protein
MIALGWHSRANAGALQLTPAGGLASDDGLRTCVLLSLFLDRRARPDDVLPDPQSRDRGGWVGTAFAPDDPIGSRLWLLRGRKHTEETRRAAEEYAAEALDWFIEARLARAVRIAAEWLAMGVLGLRIEVEADAGAFSDTLLIRL